MKKSLMIKYLYFLIFFLSLPIVISSAMKENKGKIPVTTSSEEARQEFLKGRDLSEKLKIHDSFEYFNRAIAKDNNFALAYYFRATVNPINKGFFDDMNKAFSLIDKVSEGEKLMIIALRNGANGDSKMQEENLVKLVNMYPNDERAHNLLGTFYFGQQNYDKSVDHLKKATEIAPEYSSAYNLLGYSLRNLRKFSEAEKAFQQYIKLIPDDPNPYDSYAECLLYEGKYPESIEQYRKALSVDPNFFASYYGIATNYVFLKKYDEARKELAVFSEKARDDAEKRTALFGLTVVYADEGKYDMAMEQLQKQYEIAKGKNDAGAMAGDLNNMGNILFETGKYDEAKEKYDEALKVALNSNLPNEVKENTKNLNMYNTARILLMKNDLTGAKITSKDFSEKAAKSNNTFQVWLANEIEGHIAFKEKDYKKAIKKFNMANKLNPYTFYYIGLAYKESGDNSKALDNFKTAANFNNLNNLNQAFVRDKAEKMLAVQ